MNIRSEQLANTARVQIAEALHPAEPYFSITKDPHEHDEAYRMDISIMGIGVELYAGHADDTEDLQWRFEWKGCCYDLWQLASCLLGEMWERMDDAMRHAQEMNEALAWRDVRGMR